MEATIAELIDEITRRSVGIVVSGIAFEENGDRPYMYIKGSKFLVESLTQRIYERIDPDTESKT